MTDVQPPVPAEAGTTGAAPATPAAPSASALKDPRQLIEAVLVKMLSIYEQLANANMLLSVPQVGGECGCQLPGMLSCAYFVT